MFTIIQLVLFVVITFWLYNLIGKKSVKVKLPFEGGETLLCNGYEAFIIAMFATCWIGLNSVLALRLGVLEALCIYVLIRNKNAQPFGPGFKVYTIFILWTVAGLSYCPDIWYGIRMILKYIYPLLFGMVCAKITRDGDLFLGAGIWGRVTGTLSIFLFLTPFIGFYLDTILWLKAGIITGLITYIIFCVALAYHANNKIIQILWAILLLLPAFIAVYRTDILGSAIALMAFFVIRYKVKALPLVLLIGVLGLYAMFYIPSIKAKMFYNPEEVTMEQYLKGEYREENYNMNFRNVMWRVMTERLYVEHETVGSGTGATQHSFYTKGISGKPIPGGQLHNDWLVIQCDNGDIGVVLFFLAFGVIFCHCLVVYYREDDPYIKTAAIVAGSSIVGIFVTMRTDNTMSYSMVTQTAAWGFYGMMQGLLQAKKEPAQDDEPLPESEEEDAPIYVLED